MNRNMRRRIAIFAVSVTWVGFIILCCGAPFFIWPYKPKTASVTSFTLFTLVFGFLGGVLSVKYLQTIIDLILGEKQA